MSRSSTCCLLAYSMDVVTHNVRGGYIFFLEGEARAVGIQYGCSHTQHSRAFRRAFPAPSTTGATVCVLMLLYMCPHATICVLMLLYMCSHATFARFQTRFSSSKYYRCYCMCPHATICVSSCCYMCLHTTICVSWCYYICPHTALYVSSCCYIYVLMLLYVSSCYCICVHKLHSRAFRRALPLNPAPSTT